MLCTGLVHDDENLVRYPECPDQKTRVFDYRRRGQRLPAGIGVAIYGGKALRINLGPAQTVCKPLIDHLELSFQVQQCQRRGEKHEGFEDARAGLAT